MRLAIVAVGHKQPDWVRAGCDEYLKRLPRELAARVVEIKPEPGGSKTRAQIQAAEKIRIRQVLGATRQRVIALDEKGRDLTTRQLADALREWMRTGDDTALLIGSAGGLDAELKMEADDLLRLSSLTLPHGLARLLLCEQIYRAISLLKNHPYHRE
ncbi:MAG: 23S rRNA (pseudouridine(1915)-N(3))-methyltransferase RlmH [Zoogloeaceae bacterium]|jgi:23S rRNA (pseudouridine1915-N3)-methyltransferase|nr:23S rRNA (pseudouridine(1915)-N(3))-methyltransferase RlmH [Zoogloeaceae bacterium]